MHRGKVHQTGGDAAFAPAPAFIEVYNKRDNPRDDDGLPLETAWTDIRLPRHRTMIPFNPHHVDELEENKEDGNRERSRTRKRHLRGKTVTFRIQQGEVEGVRVFYATDVILDPHESLKDKITDKYMWKAALATVMGLLTLLIVSCLLNCFDQPWIDGLNCINENPGNWVVILTKLLYAAFLTTVIWSWAGNRYFTGGLISGAIVGGFFGLITGLNSLTAEIDNVDIISQLALVLAIYILSFAAAGGVIGFVLHSKRSGPQSGKENQELDPYQIINGDEKKGS